MRRYRTADHESVWQLHDVAMREAGIHLGEGRWYDDLYEIEDIYLLNGGEFLVGVLDAEVVAMGALKKTTADRAEIKYMRVVPDLQRWGLGQIILATLERRAVELDYEALYLDTAVRQSAARRLYESNGYREVHHDKKGDIDCIFYEKELSRSA